MIKLLTLLGKCVEAVQLALQSEKISEALAIANRPSAAESKKEMWIEIAKEMLEKQQNEFEDQQSEKAKAKLKHSIDILLSEQSCLKIEDLLPMLPAKTKMRDIKKLLTGRITERVQFIGSLKETIEN